MLLLFYYSLIVGLTWACNLYNKARINHFQRVTTDSSICEIVQAIPGSIYSENNTFHCELNSCLQWCEVNTACTVAMYKPGYCRLFAVAQTTDTNLVQYLHFAEFQVYKKYPQFTLPYYSQKCSDLTRKSCVGECGWSRGKPGYNRPIYGGFEGKWCGRIKCRK